MKYEREPEPCVPSAIFSTISLLFVEGQKEAHCATNSLDARLF